MGISKKMDAVLQHIMPPDPQCEPVNELSLEDVETRVERIELLLLRTSINDFTILDSEIKAKLPKALAAGAVHTASAHQSESETECSSDNNILDAEVAIKGGSRKRTNS